MVISTHSQLSCNLFLQAAGVPVEHKLYSDTFHSFLHFPHLAQTKQALMLSQQALRKAFDMV